MLSNDLCVINISIWYLKKLSNSLATHRLFRIPSFGSSPTLTSWIDVRHNPLCSYKFFITRLSVDFQFNGQCHFSLQNQNITFLLVTVEVRNWSSTASPISIQFFSSITITLQSKVLFISKWAKPTYDSKIAQEMTWTNMLSLF